MRRCPAGWGVERDNASRTIQPRGPVIHFVIAAWRAKEAESARVKSWESIGDNLSKARLELGLCLSPEGRTIWIAAPKPIILRYNIRLSGALVNSSSITDLTHFRIFPRNLEPDFTPYLCEQRKENENL